MKFYNLKQALENKEEATELYLNRMQLRVVPREVFLLKNLKKLDVSYNEIEALQDDFGQLKQLEHLVLAHNPLQKAPAPLMQLSQLKTIDLSHTNLKIFPKYLGLLKELRALKITHNWLVEITDDIRQLGSLQRLDIRFNSLQKISRHIGRLGALEFLDLSHNQLTSLPKAIGQCKNLETLDLSHNRLNRLPESIGALKKLRKIDLDDNKLKSFPGNIGGCEQLRTIYASQNRISKIDNLGRIKSLAYLHLKKNLLKSIPSTLGHCQRLYELDLSENKLESLPEIFWTFGQLSKVDLSKNELTTLPKLGQSLKHLICNSNNISTLGDSLKHAQSMLKLELNQNPIEQIPAYFRTFKKLKHLYLRGNQITGSLPLPLLCLDQLSDFKGSIPKVSSRQLLRFIQACKAKAIPDQDRSTFFLALTGDLHAFADVPRSIVFQGLNFPIADIQYLARTQLLWRNSPGIHDNPLLQGAHVSLVGKTYFDTTELSERLRRLHINFTKTLNQQTTHILLGHYPLSFTEAFQKKNLVFLNEKTLSRYLDRAENRYLAVQQDEQQLNSIKELLLNPRDANIGLAVQLLKGGGVPEVLLTPLLLAWKFTTDRKIQKELRTLLELNISEEARRALKYPISFSPDQSQQRLASSITLLTEHTEFDRYTLEKYFRELSE